VLMDAEVKKHTGRN